MRGLFLALMTVIFLAHLVQEGALPTVGTAMAQEAEAQLALAASASARPGRGAQAVQAGGIRSVADAQFVLSAVAATPGVYFILGGTLLGCAVLLRKFSD